MTQRVQTYKRNWQGRVTVWRSLVVLSEADLLRSNIHRLLFAMWMAGKEGDYIVEVAQSLCSLPLEQRRAAHFELVRRLSDYELWVSMSINAHFAIQRGLHWLGALEATGIGYLGAPTNVNHLSRPRPFLALLPGDVRE